MPSALISFSKLRWPFILLVWMANVICACQSHKFGQTSSTEPRSLQDSTLLQRLVCESQPVIDFSEESNYSYRQLKNSLTRQQLASLTEHDDACLRVYAFNALVNQGYDKDSIEQIISRHVSDTVSVNYLSGDEVTRLPIISLMLIVSQLDYATQEKYATKIPQRNYIFEPIEIEIDLKDLEDSLK